MIRALALFTIIPVSIRGDLQDGDAARAMHFLPLIGLLLGAVAGLPIAAAGVWAPGLLPLAALAALAILALATGGLHLDGLADTADGLGSRAEPRRALEIMRQSDIGPFGVITLIFAVAASAAALYAIAAPAPLTGFVAYAPLSEQPLSSGAVGGAFRSGSRDVFPHFIAPVALAVAAMTGRLAAVHAAARGVPAAHASGFGALVAGTVTGPAKAAHTALVLGVGAGLGALVGFTWWAWPAAQAVALGVTWLFRRHVTRRLGGITGDVFGAVIEIATLLALVGLAVVAT